jgi:prepilin-type N-terminal cleavage/methylation domain-containing protein
MTMNRFARNSQGGFSLLEVLIAVVIMSVGLLALASLQLSLIRSSSETKAQSIAIALGKQKIEQLLAYESLGGAATCNSPSTSTTNTCYRQIEDEAAADVDGDPTVTGTQPIGGIQFRRAVDVQRYVYDKSTGDEGFKLVTDDNALDSALLSDPVTFLAGKEFKRVAVTVSWTDATGTGRTQVVESAIAAIDPADAAALTKSGKGSSPRKARAIITNPASVAGVIPIAIGNGSDTAATNPRPIIVSQGNSTKTVETRFDVYTYAALADGTSALAQSRVETAAIGCTCTMTANTTQSAARPTYWDGFKYTTPTTAAGIPKSAAKTGNSINQSDQCTICCRDHFDPSGVAGEKYDARRTHSHYLVSNLSTPVDPLTGGDYSESCRLIRVDGVFRVATEPFNDYFGLLGTVGLMTSTATTTVVNAVPSTGTGSLSAAYQTFVLEYLKARFVNATGYNTVLDPTTATGYSAIEVPSQATIDASNWPQYLHSRGLLIDYLSAEAIEAINDAKTNCLPANENCTATELQTAVLKLLPFTTINATELSKWTTTAPTQVYVSELQDLSESIDFSLPASGKSEYKSGNPGTNVTATTSIQVGSAGLAVTSKVFPDSAYATGYNAKSDTQLFVVGATTSGSAQTFGVTWLGGALESAAGASSNKILNDMMIGNGNSAVTCADATAGNNNGSFTCTPGTNATIPSNIPFRLSNYNRAVLPGKQLQNACNATSPTTTTAMPYVLNYDLLSYSVNGGADVTSGWTVTAGDQPGAAANSNSGEYTLVSASATPNGTIAFTFSAVSYRCPNNWATYLNNDGTAKAYPGNGDCNNGTPKTPKWSSTYAACPTGVTFP